MAQCLGDVSVTYASNAITPPTSWRRENLIDTTLGLVIKVGQEGGQHPWGQKVRKGSTYCISVREQSELVEGVLH